MRLSSWERSAGGVRGFVDAGSLRSARLKLRRDGVFLTEVAETDAKPAADRSGGRRLQLPYPKTQAYFYVVGMAGLATVPVMVKDIIGGPDGVSDELLSKASVKLSLSGLTFPHPLVRVILLEQIYRAWSILNNHPYHRA